MSRSFTEWAAARRARRNGQRILDFGDPEGEYNAARERVALFDRSDRGLLRLSGRDARDVLHRTTTQDLASFRAGDLKTTVMQTETARILDWVQLWAAGDHILAVTGEGRAGADAEWLDRVVIMDDMAIEDVSDRTARFELVGPGAARVAAGLTGTAAPEPGSQAGFDWKGHRGRIGRVRAVRPESFWLLLEGLDDGDFAGALVESFGVVPAGELAGESLRIEMGQPLPGRELTTETNPLEAGLEDAIGFTKGCYTGQEVIARMITYKSLKRRLTGFVVAGTAGDPGGGRSFPVHLASYPEEPAVGRLTSAGWSWGLKRWAGLGIISLSAAAPGTAVLILTDSGPVPAETAALPLVS